MRMKKFVALATTVVMVLASTGTAFAKESTDPIGSESGKVTGDSTYVNTVKYKITLPTSSDLNFNIDPEGLYGYFVDHPDATSVDGVDLSKYAGSVAAKSSAKVINKSSIPVVVTCKFNIEKSANLTLKELGGTIDDSKTELALGIVPLKSAQVVTSSAIALETPHALSVTSTEAKTPDQILFALEAADYEFTKKDGNTYDYVQKTQKEGVTDVTEATYAYFQVGGKVSKTANWSELTGTNAKTVSLNCVFSYGGASNIEGAADKDYAVVIDEKKIIPLPVDQQPQPTPAEPTPAEPTPAEPTPAEPTPAEPTPAEPTPAEPTPTQAKEVTATLCTVVSGTSTKITSAHTANKSVFISVDGKLIADAANKLTSMKINDTAITPSITGNLATNNNALYFKLPTGTTLKVNDVITFKVGDTAYTFKVTE